MFVCATIHIYIYIYGLVFGLLTLKMKTLQFSETSAHTQPPTRSLHIIYSLLTKELFRLSVFHLPPCCLILALSSFCIVHNIIVFLIFSVVSFMAVLKPDSHRCTCKYQTGEWAKQRKLLNRSFQNTKSETVVSRKHGERVEQIKMERETVGELSVRREDMAVLVTTYVALNFLFRSSAAQWSCK